MNTDVLSRITAECLGKKFTILCEYDKVFGGRQYIQIQYSSPCTKTGKMDEWRGRKWYLSEHMSSDEVVKTCYAAFQAAVNHEVMESFKVDGKTLFNPHVNFEELLLISHKEITRV